MSSEIIRNHRLKEILWSEEIVVGKLGLHYGVNNDLPW